MVSDTCPICNRKYSETVKKAVDRNKCLECHAANERQRYVDKKEARIEDHLKTFPLDLNYGQKPVTERFPSLHEWQIENPDKTFFDYRLEEQQFKKDNQVEIIGDGDPSIDIRQKPICQRIQGKILKYLEFTLPELVHLGVCDRCGEFLAKHPKISGANPWGSSI